MFHTGFTLIMFPLRGRFTIFLINLLGLYLIFSEDHNGCCLITGWQPPRPNISLMPAVSGKQSLMVSWLMNHSSSVGDLNEIQISRTENHIVIYSENVSVPSADLDKYTWTWTSDLPLECVDHSVRIRHLYSHSVMSPWSNWATNPGVKPNKSEIFPFQSVLREGTSAMFCCVPPPGVSIASFTRFTLPHKEYPLISIGARVKAITVHNLTIQQNNPIMGHSLFLGCTDTAGVTREILNYIGLPPQKPRNLSCVTSNMVTVSCSWDPGRKQQQTSRNTQTQTLHIENSDQVPINCQPSSCSFPAIPQLEEYTISLVVKNKLGEETENYSFNISDRVFPVVQSVRVSPGVMDATVSWSVQGNLTRLNVLCQVTTDPHSTIELNCKSVNGCCKVQLEHLIPNTRYSTRICCSVSGRLWGDWTRPVFFTTSPLVTLNLWRQIKQQFELQGRQVALLWTPHVPGSAIKEAIQGYKVQWSLKGQNRTDCKHSEQTQTEVSIGPGQYDFTVQAVLDRGLSIPAHITVPKMDIRENHLVEKRLSAAGGFNLSWAEQVTATCGYTVEWCIQGNAVPCTLQWMKMPKRNNTLFLSAGNFKAGVRYTFNIFGCAENGYRLLEIQTGYSQELNSVQSPSLVEPFQITSSSVTLEWSYNEADHAHPAFITGYLVIVQGVLPGHIANVLNVSVADPQRKSVIIGALQENHEYAFSVSALTKKGPGQPVSINIRTRRNYGINFIFSPLDSTLLAKIITPIFLLLSCTILLWPQRKMLKNRLKEIFVYPAGMNIKASELNAFLNKTTETVLSHKLEECISCDIEILNTSPPLNEMTSPGSQSCTSSLSPSSVSLHSQYCPQSATLLCDRADDQQTTCITNKTYFHSMVEDFSEPQQVMSEIKSSFEPDGLQESLSVVYDYVSNDTL